MASNPSLERHPRLDDWLSIGADGRVRVRTGKVEIGQRISTALELIVADELDVAPERIDVVRPETGIAPDEGFTSGSNSMEESGHALRLAAATAKRRLLALAASALQVAESSLEVADGLIRSRATNRSTTYWDLQGDRPFGMAVDLAAPIKAPNALRHVGRATIPRGMTDLVSGRTIFVQDMRMDGMLHARVVRPPHYHACLETLDPAACERLRAAGISIVRDGSFVAVAAADEYATIKAAERLAAAARWRGAGLEAQDVYQRLATNERVSLPVVGGAPRDAPVPTLAAPPAEATVTLRARYEKPYLMHGALGPSAALARLEDGRLTVWTHSQGIYVLRASLAEAVGMDLDALHLIHVPGPGCYGHNGADDAALDAALVARAVPGTPILLKWSREDEHAWEPYGTCMAMDLTASLDAKGSVVAWSQESFGDTHLMRARTGPDRIGPRRLLAMRHLAEPLPEPVAAPAMAPHVGIHRNLEPLYDFPSPRLVKHLVRGLPLRTSALRSLGAFANVFAIESFMDELAEAAGEDPVAFRLRHLVDERAKAVLETATAQLASSPPPPDRGRGIAFAQYKNAKTYAAVGIELGVTDAAEVRLYRAIIAADAGQVVDPGGLKAQLEGALLQAVSWTLYEAVAFDSGGITSRDWRSYPILRFDNIPEVETVLLDRQDEPFLGAGEAASGPTAAAIANALKDATGLRLRRLPFTPDAIRAAALA
jgi:CO/xanthine dehydrogenase Mo-binding subunit